MSRLASASDIIRIAGIEDTSQISVSEINSAIDDVEREIYSDYGKPIIKTYFLMNNQFATYDFTGDKKEVYIIDTVEAYSTAAGVAGYYKASFASDASVGVGKYTADLTKGEITFSASDIITYTGQRVEVEYIPIEFHLLSKYKTAVYLLDIYAIASGDEVTETKIKRLMDRIKRVEDSLRPTEVVGSAEQINFDKRQGKWIDQYPFQYNAL